MDLIRAHIDAGKPVVGIRTACHAFDAKAPDDHHASWPTFGKDVFGAEYQNHYGPVHARSFGLFHRTRLIPCSPGLKPQNSLCSPALYKNRDPVPTVTTLIQGHVDGNEQIEPVAWVNTADDRRAFYTELGSPEDFQLPAFRRLLLNGILWGLAEPIPPAELNKPKASQKKIVEVQPAISKPAAAASKPPTPTTDLPQEANSAALSAAEAAKHFKVADDLEWEQVLAEPIVAQPVFLNFDERGRMWVVQYLQYPSPAGLKMVSHDNVWRAVYDKVPPPPPHHFRWRR